MDDARSQLVDKLKSANNVLVTVSRDPSVDQLAALLGLTLLLNKGTKHAAAVFSGQVPSTIEFLQPEDTIEKNTDSLRDFIIALDKTKADKLRYKVEDNVVRIFITPYKTSISQADLEFSQGDFNVDLVVALGVQRQEDLDEAITAHGRILHDATVSSINVADSDGNELGSINWRDPQASSLCELVTELSEALGNELDNQIATALLTGIVAETERFSNDRTSSQTMSMSARLMAAGADQQLVATKLDEPPQPEESATDDDASDSDSNLDNNDGGEGGDHDEGEDPQEGPEPDDGTIEINHEDSPSDSSADESSSDTASNDDQSAEKTEDADDQTDKPLELPQPDESTPEPETTPTPDDATDDDPDAPSELSTAGTKRLTTEPPSMGGMLTANTQAEALGPSVDPMSMALGGEEPALLNHDPLGASEPAAAPDPSPAPTPASFTPPPPAWTPPASPLTPPSDTVIPPFDAAAGQSTSPSNPDAPAGDPPVDASDARDEVARALASSDAPEVAPTPLESLNAQPLGVNLNTTPSTPAPTPEVPPAAMSNPDQPPADDPLAAILNTPPTAPVTDQFPPIPPIGPAPVDLTQPAPPVMPDIPAAPAPFTPVTDPTPPTPQVFDPTAPPPVPPPIPFQFGQPPQNLQQ